MKETNLDKVSINNLIFLSNKDNFLNNRFTIKNKEFIECTGDGFNTIYSLKELEYPIYFTFHQLMNSIHGVYSDKYYGYTRVDLILLMDKVVDILMEYYINSNNKDEYFEAIIDDIDDKVFFIKQYYKYGLCLWFPTKLKEYMNNLCNTVIGASRKIVYDYIQEIKDPGNYTESSDDEDSNTEDLKAKEVSDDDSNDEDSNDEEIKEHSKDD